MATSAIDLSRQYTSFSGCDIRAVIGGQTIGTLQGISYAVQREKAPIYVMGRVDPLSFSRGKRGIAGTIVTLMLDSHIIKDPSSPFSNMGVIVDKDEIFANPTDLTNATLTPGSGLQDLDQVDSGYTFTANNIADAYQYSDSWYVDQLPPFDVVLVAANEYGKAATMRIYGAEILNEGSGFSIDDIVIENQMTYVCRTILPWQKLGEWAMTNPTTFTPA